MSEGSAAAQGLSPPPKGSGPVLRTPSKRGTEQFSLFTTTYAALFQVGDLYFNSGGSAGYPGIFSKLGVELVAGAGCPSPARCCHHQTLANEGGVGLGVLYCSWLFVKNNVPAAALLQPPKITT